jgi:hypothetical protein
MDPNDLDDADLVTLPSAHSTTETVERLKSLLSQKRSQVFADIVPCLSWPGAHRPANEWRHKVDSETCRLLCLFHLCPFRPSLGQNTPRFTVT